ncbi:MAG TPA: pseudouridine synthase [Ktedonobacterales bacterium]|nr:pseudouridine synthase [Ktedonobacterales bacterium]
MTTHDPSPPPRPPTGERLQKYLAHAGVASRRHAEELIVAGAVSVNGAIVRELGTRVDPAHDEIRLHGRPVKPPAREHLYILLNKPTDTVTTAYDPQRRRTVLDLLPDEWVARRVYPVGRLDRDTEGLLLLTDDGDLALKLTHPRYALTKQYAALVAGLPTPEALRTLERGLLLPGEQRPTAPARAWLEQRSGDAVWIGVELHEGRNRQVRRMLEAIGHPALRLRRVRVGPLTLGNLPAGQSRLLTAHEVENLRRAVSLGPTAEH